MSPAAKLLAFTDTSDASRHLAMKAQRRLVIITPYMDAAACAWVLDMFRRTSASERVLVLQTVEELSKPGVDRDDSTNKRADEYGGPIESRARGELTGWASSSPRVSTAAPTSRH